MVNAQGYDEVPLDPAKIAALYDLAKELRLALEEVEAKTAELKLSAQRLLKLQRETIPERMRELDLTELKVPGGYVLGVEDKVQASISKEREDAAHRWLTDNGHGGMIKRELSVAFGREEAAKGLVLMKELLAKGYLNIRLEDWVEPPTLKAFARDRVVAGDEKFPRELFGVFRFDEATLKEPKKPRKRKGEGGGDSVFREE